MTIANVTNKSSLVEKTVYLRTNYGVMGNTKKVSNAVLSTNADTRILKIQKTLLDSKELEAIRTADGKMRNYLYRVCLPYDMGIQLLPLTLLESVHDTLTAYADERTELVNIFCIAYPELCKKAEQEIQTLAFELGLPFETLWNPSDYPDVETVRSKFTFEFQYISFAVPESLKFAGIYEAEMTKAQEKIQTASEEITLLMRQTMLDLISHLKTALEPSTDGKTKRLFASSVINIQEFLDTFKARNITNDDELDALVTDVSKIIHPNFSVDVLKKDDAMKTAVHDTMQTVTEKLSMLVETVPGRKFKK